jgi:Holliday junction resolvase RusA-like endonuclease
VKAIFTVRDPEYANNLYRTNQHGRMYKPKSVREYQARCKQWALLAARAARWPPLEQVARVRLSYDVYANCDADGPLKITMDACQGALYVNDRCVEIGTLRAFPVKRKDPRKIVIQVELL